MTGKKLPTGPPDNWSEIITRLMAYRGYSSPKKLEEAFPREQRPGRMTVERIKNLTWTEFGTDAGDNGLIRLAGALKLPYDTLILLYRNDVEGIRRLDFSTVAEGEEVRRLLLDLLQPGKPRAARRARSSGD